MGGERGYVIEQSIALLPQICDLATQGVVLRVKVTYLAKELRGDSRVKEWICYFGHR